MRPFSLAAAACFLLAAPSIALAHALLSQAAPAVDGTVKEPPTQVEITFSQAVEPRFSSITVAGSSGARMDKQDVHAVAGDARRLAVSVTRMQPGTYKVTWQVTGVDTHRTDGAFTFTVAP